MKLLFRRLMRGGRLAVLLLVFALFACQSVPFTIKEVQLQGIKKIGVASIIGNELSFVYVGPTVFNNKYRSYDIRNWKIDDFVTRTIKNAVTSETSFQYVDVEYSPETFKKLYDSRVSHPYYDYDVNVIKEELRQIGIDNSVDTLILVAKSIVDREPPKGLGVFQRSIGIIKYTKLIVRTSIRVFDVDSMEILALRYVLDYGEIDDSRWTDDFSSLPVDEQRFFEDAVKEIFKRKIPAQMKAMGLLPIPPGGLPDESVCTSDGQCASGYCDVRSISGGNCRPRPNLPYGADCTKDAECASGRCEAHPGQPGRICN